MMNNQSSRILVVDDVDDNLLIMRAILSEEGYRVSTYNNGIDAIASIIASPPDLILLDVMMPDLDGYEITFKIRSLPYLPFIPILLVAADESQDLADGLDLGADDFVYKPLKINELLGRVRNLLRLKHSIDNMQEMSKAQEDFVSRLTHDLRTPLVAADRMLSLLHKGTFGELTPNAKKAISTISGSNQNLMCLVDTLPEVHRFEAGCKRLTTARFNLTKMIQEVVMELEPLALGKGLSLAYSQQDSTPIKIVGDRLELRRVVTNLVGNALKFTDSGYVKIAVVQDAEFVSISIEDTGIGIELSEQATLFERFRTGNHTSAGSGLGLHLSHRIIEAHQGCITVASKVGQGSIFNVRLPNTI